MKSDSANGAVPTSLLKRNTKRAVVKTVLKPSTTNLQRGAATSFKKERITLGKLNFLWRDRYGNDSRAINKHSSKVYEDVQGNTYILDRNLSICPPCFEAIGPIPKNFQGICPVIPVNGLRLWGDGLSWRKAERIFLDAVEGGI